jgi:hypothetical protein
MPHDCTTHDRMTHDRTTHDRTTHAPYKCVPGANP